MASVTFRCSDEFKDKLDLEAKENNVSLSVYIVNRLTQVNSSSHSQLDVEKNIKIDSEYSNGAKPTDYISEERFDFRTQTFVGLINKLEKEIEDLKDANNYLHKPLHPFIEDPKLLNALQENKEQVVDFIERLKDPATTRMIGITPEVFGGRF